ncbi:hypothetical protein SDC9_93585 [bioreactor metagenome]|uniref:Uncharacterized protein n=1 Tax=bioreactor metagenome TaxID=1076179 RepID=A0A645A2C3_9ZZZZ
MTKPQTGRGTFVIQILNQQNATWQGTITWTDGKKSQPFRSLLELIKLIDSALENGDEPPPKNVSSLPT